MMSFRTSARMTRSLSLIRTNAIHRLDVAGQIASRVSTPLACSISHQSSTMAFTTTRYALSASLAPSSSLYENIQFKTITQQDKNVFFEILDRNPSCLIDSSQPDVLEQYNQVSTL